MTDNNLHNRLTRLERALGAADTPPAIDLP